MPPLIAHVVYRLEVGGLENVLVELLNRLPAGEFRHVVICLTRCGEGLQRRVKRQDIAFYSLDKGEGQDWGVWWRMVRLLRRLKPDLLHTCNLAALEMALPAWVAGVRHRLHAEHGRDIYDLTGSNPRYRRLRRWLAPWLERVVAVSGELEQWLLLDVGLPRRKVTLIRNGVDLDRFRPRAPGEPRPRGWPPAWRGEGVVIGWVGRMAPVKDPMTLLAAFRLLVEKHGHDARLLLVGDGPLRREVADEVARQGLGERVWLAGERADIPALMRAMDLFALPSLAEGTPLTLLEAMASGLPVVASRVGGIPELVREGENGLMTPPSQPATLAAALARYAGDAALRHDHGAAARRRMEDSFAMAGMVAAYADLYRELLGKK